MKRLKFSLAFALTLASIVVAGQTNVDFKSLNPEFSLDGKMLLSAPAEGLWGVSTEWKDGWMEGWVYADADSSSVSGKWTNLYGSMVLPQGKMVLRDSWREYRPGLYQCRRRFEWMGPDMLEHANLSVRLRLKGSQMQTFMPGIVYYGNRNGAKINREAIAVYDGTPGEFAIFEDHRFPMPFAMLENAAEGYAAAVHITPSPVKGAIADQWWSFGVEAGDGYADFVMYTGPVGYNNKHGVAKARQRQSMLYDRTWIDMEPGQVIEKEFFVELYPVEQEGSGFQLPVYTSLDLFKPYYADKYDSFASIVEEKYRFAKSRWITLENGAEGFDMYDTAYRQEIVMGWCGQAASPGYALQVLEEGLKDAAIHDYVQKSLDFLTTFPDNDTEGTFAVRYKAGKYDQGDPVSCGQAMYNFAKAIKTARGTGRYDTSKWEAFLRRTCDNQSRRILANGWNPKSTAEGFLIAPLAIASQLFDNQTYKAAALKIAQLYAERHLAMNGCYWGGTLDAQCEDKEGAWAAFQGFLELYEQFGDQQYLKWAKHAMDVCLSYVVVWRIPLPAGRMSDYNFDTTGWTVVSAQNQHIDIYGVFFAPEIYKMGNYLGDQRLKDLARVMYRTCSQITDPFGSQGEQLQHTNYAQHGSMSDIYKLRGGYSEHWTVFWITAHFLNAAARFTEMGVEP